MGKSNIGYATVAVNDGLGMDSLFQPLGKVFYSKDAFADLLGEEENAVAVTTSTGTATEVLNSAVRNTDSEYVCLVLQDFIGVYDSHSSDQKEDEDLQEILDTIVDIMKSFDVGCGGLTPMQNTKVWENRVISTINSMSTKLLIIDKDKFLGFRDLPYPYNILDYQIRSVIEDGGVARLNTNYCDTATIDDESVEFKEWNRIWGHYSKVKKHKAGKHITFNTPMQGVG